MTSCSSIRTYPISAIVALVLSAQVTVTNADTLIQGATVSITTQDMQADSLRMPPEMRSIVLQKPETVTQIASNLYARRMFAERALAEGLQKDPQIAAALKIARDKVLSDAMLEQLDKKAAPSDAAAEALARDIYRTKSDRFKQGEQVQVSHILIPGNESQSRAQAEKLLEEIKAGADFAKAAQERSADTGSATKGGDLGFFGRGRMLPEFETVAFNLAKVGDVSDVVETKFGFHILKLTGKKPAGIRPFEEVKDELVKEVRNNVQQEARAAEAQKLQQGATINKEAIEGYAAGFKAAR